MRRREFIAGLSATAAWPLAARAQQGAVPVIGYLHVGSSAEGIPFAANFINGLSEAGYTLGRNVAIEYRFAEDKSDRLPELAADLVRRRVAVIATLGGLGPASAAKAATTTIPIVFGSGGDPVQGGLVTSLNRPGGNLTGISFLSAELVPKRLELMHQLLPRAARFAVLVNPNSPSAASNINTARAAASAIGTQIEFFDARTDREIDTAFASLVQKRADALVLAGDPIFSNGRVHIATLAARHAVPTISYDRAFAEAGGLMSYGSSLSDQYRQVGIYTGRVLKGEKPADLPVVQPTRFELVINLKTAKTLGLEVPQSILLRADEVIE
jgi:putative tryptophan/tyrosine transport system substrate-binding protein